MKHAQRPAPIHSESPFTFDEFFFSTTDKKGVIRFGNDVFTRVSAYPRDAMFGAPHNLIRHPDMPRSVFREFWNFLLQGKPVGTYVKNLTGDGRYYWVYALAFPTAGGFMSIRFKPSSAIFHKVIKLYQDVLAFEQQKHGLKDSHQYFLEKITEAGYRDYESFMLEAVIEELRARAKRARGADFDQAHAMTRHIIEVTRASSARLAQVFDRLGDFQAASASLESTIGTLDQAFRQLKFISINIKIASARFGNAAAALGVVSSEFAIVTEDIEKHLGGLSGFILESGLIQKCELSVAVLNVQMLMVDFFVRESIAKRTSSADAFADMFAHRDIFSDLFASYCRTVETELQDIRKSIGSIDSELLKVGQFVSALEIVRQIGAIEAARTDEIRNSFAHYLATMAHFIQLLRDSTHKIREGVLRLSSNAEFIVAAIRSVSGSVDEIFSQVSSLQLAHTG